MAAAPPQAWAWHKQGSQGSGGGGGQGSIGPGGRGCEAKRPAGTGARAVQTITPRETRAQPGAGHGLVATVTCTRGFGGGGGRRPKKDCVPKIDLRFRVPSRNFIFVPEDKCSDVRGVGVRRRSPDCPPPPCTRTVMVRRGLAGRRDQIRNRLGLHRVGTAGPHGVTRSPRRGSHDRACRACK